MRQRLERAQQRAHSGPLAEFAQQNFPGLIVVVSGEDELVLPLQFRFLKKPYRPSDVLRLVAF